MPVLTNGIASRGEWTCGDTPDMQLLERAASRLNCDGVMADLTSATDAARTSNLVGGTPPPTARRANIMAALPLEVQLVQFWLTLALVRLSMPDNIRDIDDLVRVMVPIRAGMKAVIVSGLPQGTSFAAWQRGDMVELQAVSLAGGNDAVLAYGVAKEMCDTLLRDFIGPVDFAAAKALTVL